MGIVVSGSFLGWTGSRARETGEEEGQAPELQRRGGSEEEAGWQLGTCTESLGKQSTLLLSRGVRKEYTERWVRRET